MIEAERELRLAVAHPSDVAVMRSTALHFARVHGATDRTASHVAIIAGELASNLVRHAAGGTIVLLAVADPDGIVIRSLDRASRGDIPAGLQAAPRETPRMVEDSGAFRAGLGCGLGAIRRLSTQFWVTRREDEMLEVAALCLLA